MLSRHITIGPDSRRERVVVNMIAISGNAISARLKPQEADDLIAKLGHARAALRQEVERDLHPRSKLDFTVVDPAWRTSTEHPGDTPGIALALRHSGYGWLCFLLPPAEARALSRWLLYHADEAYEEEGVPSPKNARLDRVQVS